jgi:hypothetical protein
VVVVGETLMDEPVPTKVPPQLPEYHTQDAPDPKAPPDTLNTLEPPPQSGLGLALAEEGGEDPEFTLTVTAAQPVVLQFPSALTK